MFNIYLLTKAIANPSITHGKKLIFKAVFPTFFNVLLLIPRPALKSITINAIFLKSGDIVSISLLIKFNILGPTTIPNISIPNNPGNFIALNNLLNISPNVIIIAKLSTIL